MGVDSNMMTRSSAVAVSEALKEYKEVVDKAKQNPYSLSEYTVTKPWGEERWVELNDTYAMKVIQMKAGERSSLQSHNYKVETNIVIEGRAIVEIFPEGKTEDGTFNHGIVLNITEGEGWSVPAGIVHRVKAVTDYKAIEVSSPHLLDVIRHEDDTGRKDGKVDGEHI